MHKNTFLISERVKYMKKKLLLLFGFVLIFIFIFFVLKYFINSESQYENGNVKQQSAQQISIKKKMQAKLPSNKDDMIPPNASEIIGKWFSKFGKDSIAEITFINGRFELIYTDDPQGWFRKYSKGTYKYYEDSGKITLYPSNEFGKPKAIPGVSYKIMTLRHYDMFLLKQPNGRDIYFSAPETQLVSKNYHPLFLYTDYSGAPVLKFSPLILEKK